MYDPIRHNYQLSEVKVQFEGGARTVQESHSRFRRRVNPCVKIVGFSSVDIPILLSYSGGNAIGINA